MCGSTSTSTTSTSSTTANHRPRLPSTACSFPLMVKRFPFLKVPHQFLFLSKHFGTGVLIATAFVHLLPTAFTSLTDPCLPKFWNEGYPAMAGLIAMTAVFFVVVIEMIFSTMNGSPTGGCHSGDLSSLTDDSAPTPQTRPLHRRGNSTASIISLVGRNGGAHGGGRRNLKHSRSNSQSLSHLTRGGSFETERLLNHNSSSPHPSDPSTSTAIDSDSDSDSESLSGTELKPITRRRRSSTTSSTSTALHAPRLSSAQRAQKSLLQVLLLEAGILFHSIFIGMALSVATGPTFIVLLIAIVFHQTFEGLALGSRIAALSVFKEGDPKPWLMCLAYGTTTPIGQAVGLVARDWYEPGSEGGLVVVGVMNAISSGLLVFAGLVELLAEDFVSMPFLYSGGGD